MIPPGPSSSESSSSLNCGAASPRAGGGGFDVPGSPSPNDCVACDPNLVPCPAGLKTWSDFSMIGRLPAGVRPVSNFQTVGLSQWRHTAPWSNHAPRCVYITE
eukprot:4463578-Pyramimonas_sp.AAC.1